MAVQILNPFSLGILRGRLQSMNCTSSQERSNDRSGLVQKFQENEVYRAAILSIKAAGVGLTLTAASLVIMAELDWTPGNLVQAEDRAHRIGQASSVLVHYLHMKGSIDDIIWQTLQ